MFPGQARPDATARFASAAGHAAPGHFRAALDGLTLSSVGMGTYLGNSDDATDAAVSAAAAGCLCSGLNVLDSAINYRSQRGERSLGRMFDKMIPAGRVRREEVFVSTKAGYIPFDGARPRDPAAYVRDAYIATGLSRPEEIVGGSQCIAPAFLRDQVRRCRENLRLQTIDLFYLHNPEYMIRPLGKSEWLGRLRAAFALLEEEAGLGHIAAYGTATWDGYRVGPEHAEHLDMLEMLAAAQSVGGARHHFRAIQLPLSLSAPEAAFELTQTIGGTRMTALSAAQELGVTVFASAPLGQGEAIKAVPADWAAHADRLGLKSGAQRALHWTRTRPGLTCALVGMKDVGHVRENLELVKVRPEG